MVIRVYWVLCEGAEGCSEWAFIKCVLECCKVDEVYKLISAYGKNKIPVVFENDILPNLSHGDVFILIFDNLGSGKLCGIPIPAFLKMVIRKCRLIDVRFKCTNYYCFEELFLSYGGSLDLIEKHDERFKEEICLIQSDIMADRNYYELRYNYWFNYFNSRNNAGVMKNRETLAAGICADMFKGSCGSFAVLKERLGQCWVKDCVDVEINKYICDNKCKYKMKGCTFKDKLLDMDNNSVSALSNGFSTIYD